MHLKLYNDAINSCSDLVQSVFQFFVLRVPNRMALSPRRLYQKISFSQSAEIVGKIVVRACAYAVRYCGQNGYRGQKAI